jgi:hypothetical protein
MNGMSFLKLIPDLRVRGPLGYPSIPNAPWPLSQAQLACRPGPDGGRPGEAEAAGAGAKTGTTGRSGA